MPIEPVRSNVSRRGLLSRIGFGSLAVAGLAGSASNPLAAQTVFNSPGISQTAAEALAFESSLNAAYAFLDRMMDAYVSGSTVRLSQSYSDAAFAGFPYVGFTYDNAVAIQAYLARGSGADVARAEILGNGLVDAQNTNFPVADGRFAQAYYVNAAGANGAYVTPAAYPFYFYTSAVGDQAWAGMALARLYQVTHNSAYLTAALKVANWIVTNTYNTAGFGGYLYGTNINPSNQSVPSPNGQSTEHNIDTYAFFTMLAQLTGNANSASGMSWSNLAQHALLFVQAMFNSSGGFFYTGTTGPGSSTIATGNIPEDVQTWSYLALKNPTYAVSLDWVKTNLSTTDTPSDPNSALKGLGNIRLQGETYATASLASAGNDEHAVWLEGTAHTAAALLARRLPPEDDVPLFYGDILTAAGLLANIQLAQAKLGAGQTVNGMAIPLGQGVVSASGNLDTGFNFDYFPNLHIGATGWYVIALQGGNPFRLRGW